MNNIKDQPFIYLLANGIRCYVCEDCSDKGVETDCDTIPEISFKVTKCAKREVGGKVTRGCHIPGQRAALVEGCTEVGGDGDATHCICSTNLCNKSATLDKTPIFFPISVFLVTKYLLKAF